MMSTDRLPSLCAAIERGMTAGLHIGAQLYVSRGSEVVADLAIGESRPGVMMSPETLMLWLSAGKPIAAAAILQLRDLGLCTLDNPVATHIPEFAAGGKEAITIRQLLTHTGGFRWVDVGNALTPWDEIIRRICVARIERDWTPGARAGYHPYTSWYILGELVRRLDGRPFQEYVRDEIFLPLGMHNCWIGMSAEQYQAYGLRLGQMQNTERGEGAIHTWSTPEGVTHCAPGGNGHGPMRELATFYETLLADGQRNGTCLLQPATVAEMISPERVGMLDETFKQKIDWGLGVILDSKHNGLVWVPYGYGRHASSRAFGHSGSQSSVAFADPEYGLVAAIVLNGTPGEARHQPRMREILECLYVDLGLAST